MQYLTRKAIPRWLGVAVLAGGCSLQALAETKQLADGEAVLSTVKVEAAVESDTRPVKGYRAKKSTTATRTDTELIDVPQSVTVITQEVIKDQSVQSMSDAVRYVPGVTAAQGEGNRDAVNIRGAGVSTGDFYLDGMRDDIQTYRDFYNTDRIEVLKGPNGMIFGRAAAGGAINRVSKEAGWDPVREVAVSLGAYEHKRMTLDVGNGLNETMAFRINAVAEDSGSYRDGVEIQRHGINPTLTLMPTERTKITLGYEYFKDERIGDRGVPSVTGGTGSTANLNNRPFRIGDTDRFFGSAGLSPNETETNALNAMIEHAFSNGLMLRNRTRYADYDKFYENVYASGPVNPANGQFNVEGYIDFTDRRNLLNQTDLIYTAQWGSVQHKLVAGMELGRQDTDNARLATFFGADCGVRSADNTRLTLDVDNSSEVPDCAVTLAPNLLNGNNPFRDNTSRVNNVAFYLQDQIVLNAQWQAIFGVRHDRFETRFDGSRRKGGSAADSNTIVSESFDVIDNKLSPRAGLIFKPVQNLSLYASYSQTFVPRAGDQLTALTASTQSLSPEKFTNHEIGAKFDVTPELSLTAAIYRLQRENMAVTDPVGGIDLILVDGQETNGIELGVSGKLTGKWSVFGGYAYQDGEITEQQGTGNNAVLKGSKLAQTPEHTFSLWNRYDFNATWGVALGVISRSEMYAVLPTATTSTVLPGYTRFDAALYGKLSDKLRLQVNLENLTNKAYALDAHNNNNITPGSPFNGRMTLTYQF